MVGGRKFERRGNGPLFWALLVIVIFILYSGSVAALTADDCGKGVDKSWQIFPPEWECGGQLPGYG